MAFIGLATTNPIFSAAMLDRSKWRSVVYADTPRCLERYAKWRSSKKDTRKVVVQLIGATNLSKVLPDSDMFHSIIVFDDVENLHILSQIVPGFTIADIEDGPAGHMPSVLGPADLTLALSDEGGFPDATPLLSKVKSMFGRQRPSVLESTSNMPNPESAPRSGVQRLLSEIKCELEETESSLPFAVVIDYYCKFMFRMLPRSKVTSTVTKHLPKGLARDLWSNAIDMATSKIGERMYTAYRKICDSDDPDYRVSHAVAEFDLKEYAGDFVYLSSVLPPSSHYAFTEAPS